MLCLLPERDLIYDMQLFIGAFRCNALNEEQLAVESANCSLIRCI